MCFIVNDFFGNPELDQTAIKNHLKQVIAQVNRTNRSPSMRFASTLGTDLIDRQTRRMDQQLKDCLLINRRIIDLLPAGYTIENDDALVEFLDRPQALSPQNRSFLTFLRPHQRALFLTQIILLEDQKTEPFFDPYDLSFSVILLSLILTRENHNGNVAQVISDYILLLSALGQPNNPNNHCLFATRELPTYQTPEGKEILISTYNDCLPLIT